MRRFALMTGAALLAVPLATMTAAGSAEAYEWGGGTCIGDGYRVVRRDQEEDVRPGMRVYEHRRVYRHHDWDDDDDLDD